MPPKSNQKGKQPDPDILPDLVGIPKLRRPKNGIEENAPPKEIKLSDDSWKILRQHLDTVGIERKLYAYTARDQSDALILCSDLGLYIPGDPGLPRDVQNKLSIIKSIPRDITKRGDSKKEHAEFNRVVRYFQCQCGADEKSGRNPSKSRQIPWKNVGCLVWLKLVTTHQLVRDETCNGSTSQPKSVFLAVDEISGTFDHSDACDAQVMMDRNPRVPLHPELRQYCLGLLRENTPLALLRKKALEFSNKKWPNGEPGDNHARFRLTLYDSCSLYRTLAAEKGIPQRSSAEENLDLWFRKIDPKPPSPLLTASCVHYQPHIHPDTERFELFIITPEMREAAWKYGHKQQILMDLTFGFSTGRVNLGIFMALNEEGKGEPIGKFLFTARDSAKAVHADYNTLLCTHFTGILVDALGTNEHGEKFEPYVANTDNDPKERKALAHHFPLALLLLCSFHMMQAWRNNLVKSLAGVSKDDRPDVRKRVGAMLRSLLHVISDYDQAHQLYLAEVAYWNKQSRRRNDTAKTQARSGLKFLTYFETYIKDKDYWLTWSPAGALEAARRLGVPVSRIARTNNALESWNGRLKGGLWEPYQHSGYLPRPDYWVLITITEVLPDFFAKIKRDREMQNYYRDLRMIQPAACTADTTGVELPKSDRQVLVEKWLSELEGGDGPEDVEVIERVRDELEPEGANDELGNGSLGICDGADIDSVGSADEMFRSDRQAGPSSNISHFSSSHSPVPSPHAEGEATHQLVLPDFSDGVIVECPSFTAPVIGVVDSSVLEEQYQELHGRILVHTGDIIPWQPTRTSTPPNRKEEQSIVADSDVEMGCALSSNSILTFPDNRGNPYVTPNFSDLEHSENSNESPAIPDENSAGSLSSDDLARINKRTTAMMSLQQAHDGLWNAARDLVKASGKPPNEALHCFKGYITPTIWERLENMSLNSSQVSLQLDNEEVVGAEQEREEEEYIPGPVPFKRQRKEKRIQSHRDR